MQDRTWQQAIAASADPKRVQHRFDHLPELPFWPRIKKPTARQAGIVTALLAGSQALTDWLFNHPHWFEESVTEAALEFPRQRQGLERELKAEFEKAEPDRQGEGVEIIRRFQQRELLRIGTRDLARLATLEETTTELAQLADVCLEETYQICRQKLSDRLGEPYHQLPNGKWARTPFCVLGMGKFGSRELNYNSDVDLLFLYAEEGAVFKTPPKGKTDRGKTMSSHQFFNRLAEALTQEVGKFTEYGSMYRVDLRLRPEGESGPLTRSLQSYENFYAQYGQTWERMMLMKARPVAGDESLGMEFLEMIQPFRFPRSLGHDAMTEIAATKERLESEVVKSGELDRNVKLGRGGIREIEFIVQSMQLLHGGKTPFIQEPRTLPALKKLVGYHLIQEAQAERLAAAYPFLRDLEHRLQMENNQQTHTIPTDRQTRERLARLMGHEDLRSFEKALSNHQQKVREVYQEIFVSPAPEETQRSTLQFSPSEWTAFLQSHRFRDPPRAHHLVETFLRGPGFVHVSSRTEQLGRLLLQRFFHYCQLPSHRGEATAQERGGQKARGSEPIHLPDVDPSPLAGQFLSDPDRVLARLDSFIQAYGTRAMLYETWHANLALFDLILFLFDRSEFLAETSIRIPDLVDSLTLSGHLRRRKTAAEILKELCHGREDEDQKAWIRKYHQSELMRIGLRDILGLADFEQNLAELSALAISILDYGLDVVTRRHDLRKPPFAIIGFGKLGGDEITYGSDLDIVLVSTKVPNAAIQKLAVEFIDLVAVATEHGSVFEIDLRLRPDGEKGLLANNLEAYEEYYRKRAALWEIQSLSRARAIAGEPSTGAAFEEMTRGVLEFFSAQEQGTKGSPQQIPVAAWQKDWRTEIFRMRERIEKERTPAGQDHLAIKTGSGGLIDGEFVAQMVCLENGWHEPNTLRALERIKKELPNRVQGVDSLIENYRKLRRMEGILRRWSYASETVLPEDEAAFLRVANRCGFEQAEDFARELKECRGAIRKVWESFRK